MGLFNEAQHWLIEVFGTVIFIVSGIMFLIGLFTGTFTPNWYVDLIGLIVGLYLMGYRAIPDKIKSLISN